MITQEIFKKADVENVFNAYILIRPVFDDLDRHTMQEKVMALKGLRKHINEVCTQIATCDIDTTDESKTLFVIGRTRTGWAESYIQDLECFSTKDKDAIEAVKKDFTMWNDDGEVRLDFYGLDFVSLPVLAGYRIAKKSVLEQGTDVCCAVILHDLFLWGITEDQHKKSLKELVNKLKEAEEDLLHNRTISHEELWAELEKDFLNKGTEDEKEHYRLEREYHNKVKEIEERHMMSIINKDHQRFIDIVRDEYSDRLSV